jgi:hydroxymethylglutaryl-CoA synthase
MNLGKSQPGISAVSLYVPPFRVSLKDWCVWTGNSWDKINAVVGNSFRIRGPHENVYTMAANAVLRLIRTNDIDPRQIGFLALGTESSTDNAAGAVIVRGIVDLGLERLGLPRLSRQLEVPEFKHACLGGIYGVKGALRYVAYDGATRQAIVVCADSAEYERGSSGEQTQGAGAVAMLIERTPRLLEIDLMHAGNASDYRVLDFRKPIARHFMDGYATRGGRLTDFPVFNGRYSTHAYLDETAHAVENMLAQLDVSADIFYRDVRALFFHRPYHLMPVQAMAMLYVRALARSGDRNEELASLCAEAGVAREDVLRETVSTPDLRAYATIDRHTIDPSTATSTVSNVLRKRASFQVLAREKMSLGSEAMKSLGNLYTAALPAWIAAGLEEGAQRTLNLAGAPMAAIGYGSGDAAEAIPLRVCEGWEAAARKIRFAEALDHAIDLDRTGYESMHDHGVPPDMDYVPRGEFAIARVGTEYTSAFQDIGIEYYEYVP